MRIAIALCALGLLPFRAPATPASQREMQAALHATPDVAHGERLFVACAACHTSTGGGTSDGNVPSIAGQYFEVIIKQLVDFRHGQRRDVRMERYSGDHVLKGSQDIADVARYVSTRPVPPDTGAASASAGDDGRRQYEQFCTSCHGRGAQGSRALRVPAMAGQHSEYLLRQMQYALERRRPNFSREHAILMGRFELSELQDMAGYIAGLAPPH
jgi:cytochrome c553